MFRTDRTIPFFHPSPTTMEADLQLENLRTLQQLLLAHYAQDPELEYVQGMADLLSPILFVVRDAAEAFWMFVRLMQRQRDNFALDGRGIELKMRQIQELVRLVDPQFYDYLGFSNDSAQLFFCYRWLLVLFKREFSFADTLVVWETILASEHACYEVYVAAAILDLAKEGIMSRCDGFGETLAYLTEMTHAMDVEAVLDRADQLYRLFTEDSKMKWLLHTACM